MARDRDPLVVGRVIGDVLDSFTKSINLSVAYNDREVSNGCDLKPSQVVNHLRVDIGGDDLRAFHTLVMVDPDSPSPSDPHLREYLHWLVTDIPATTGSRFGFTTRKLAFSDEMSFVTNSIKLHVAGERIPSPSDMSQRREWSPLGNTRQGTIPRHKPQRRRGSHSFQSSNLCHGGKPFPSDMSLGILWVKLRLNLIMEYPQRHVAGESG
ncbi:FT like protein [Tanacetum coccineum]|uniref:FT like protein n=1 Tax=Tanacetum coccineum TaxID=301880 RepID=A0ABQ5BE78_9ASTR